MKKTLVICVGMLALLLESCSFLPWFSSDGEGEIVESADTVSPSPSELEEATEIVVEPKPIGTPSESGLIPPTDPDRQRQAIAKGRQDPFDPFAVQPIVTVEPLEEQPNNTAAPTASKPVAAKPASPPAPRPGATKPVPKPGTTKPAPAPPMAEPLPPLAALAKKVVVMGVIEIEGITQVILKAPNEASSRYVQPGQYVANGNVLVKEVERYSELPVVVLEQDGIEVLKSVGEGVEKLPEAEPDAAAISLLSRNN